VQSWWFALLVLAYRSNVDYAEVDQNDAAIGHGDDIPRCDVPVAYICVWWEPYPGCEYVLEHLQPEGLWWQLVGVELLGLVVLGFFEVFSYGLAFDVLDQYQVHWSLFIWFIWVVFR